MPRRNILALGLIALLLMVPLFAGCGGGDGDEATTESAAETANDAVEAATDAAEAVTDAAEAVTDAAEAVVTHDCAGGCGMTNVPEDQMTEVHGQWYCAGCAKKAEEDHGHSHG